MKFKNKSQSAFMGFCVITALLTGCQSNAVNGYFAAEPSSSSASVTSAQPTATPVAGPTGGAPVGAPTAVPTLAPTSIPTSTPTPTATPTASPTQTPVALPSAFVPNGILNGHFDVDTATSSMPFPTSKGTVTYHVHEYDKLNQTTTVNFFNIINNNGDPISGTEFDQIQNTIDKTRRFYLVVVNASLNPGGVLEVNGSVQRVTDYQNLTQQLLSGGVHPAAYTIGAPQVAGDIQLNSLKIGFDSNVTANALLVPTAPTDCVFPDIPGKLGEYRDGALVIQAVDASTIELNASTGATTSDGGLIWEGLIYNHYMLANEVDPEICY